MLMKPNMHPISVNIIYKNKHRRKPKYMLDTRKLLKVRVNGKLIYTSECSIMYNKTLTKKRSLQKRWEDIVQDKVKKWVRKHPKPCQNDDIFADFFLSEWENKKNTAEERFRDMIVSKYVKLQLIGRFKRIGGYNERVVAWIKDVDGCGHDVNVAPNTSKTLKLAQNVTDDLKSKNNNLICTRLYSHKLNTARIILPKAA